MISQGKYPWGIRKGVVPGCDGAGIVLAIGSRVSRFTPGDKVVTLITQGFTYGKITREILSTALGARVDGTFRQVGAFDEQGLVAMPKGLSFNEAATLSCAGVTAWNALFGDRGRKAGPGDWVLSLGTGGVSLFVVQLAKAAGAGVIATTSSEEKTQLLRRLGADHVLNYKEDRNWGAKAKELTGGVGVDVVVDVAGPSTLRQSVESVRIEGLIVTLGAVGGMEGADVPSLLEAWLKNFTVRGIWTGSREQLEDLSRAIESKPDVLRPVVDTKVFKLEQLKEALAYLQQGKHQGSVVVEID
jgi:NADPH:quinone reductase-like Zn-dependent oxidoreductase